MAVSAWTRGDDRAELQQHTRGITQILSRSVGAASPYRGSFGEAPEKKILFRGAERKLEFVTQVAPFPTAIPVAFTAVVIALEEGSQGRGLVISQRILPNREPFSEAVVVLRDPSVQSLEFSYLSPEGSWADTWDGDQEKKLPTAIRIRTSTTQNGKLEPSPPITVSLRAIEPL